ncbi:MAG TPA: haloacid dehalogenase type II [Mycobacteriales bacterium]|nr:haloacid dehalogenase type II [Mycobacteriales bacterium]
MAARPTVLVFDVNGTLSDLSPLADRLAAVGAPPQLLSTWFAATLRDGIGLAAAGAFAPFDEVAAAVLTMLLTEFVDGDPARAAAEVLAEFSNVPLHADVPPALRSVHANGLRLATLTNGSRANAERLLERGGVADLMEQVLSVDAVRRWKPARDSYDYAVEACAAEPSALMLVAAHPWDIDGASRAGWSTCWVNRERLTYPAHLTAPDLVVSALTDLDEALHL